MFYLFFYYFKYGSILIYALNVVSFIQTFLNLLPKVWLCNCRPKNNPWPIGYIIGSTNNMYT